MARSYKAAQKSLKEDPSKPFNRRNYQLVMVDPAKSKFDEDKTTLKAVQEEDGANEELHRFALRTQEIKDPTRPIGDARLLQFFVQSPNSRALVQTPTVPRSGIIVEVDGAKETPLFMLNSDEVWELAHGNGYNAPILTASVPTPAG